MNHIGLFEGIGGFSLAARWMGWNTIAWCEWNEFGQKVLRHHFPEAEGHGDITKTDFTQYANRIDILTGGFPCQPYSTAGKRLGTADDRHLWPEMLRAIREIQPRWVVGENVSGLVNWNGGMVFDQVQADLEAEGYEVIPFILPACGVNAPHRRDRVWFVAYGENIRCGDTEKVGRKWKEYKPYDRKAVWSSFNQFSEGGFTPDTSGNGCDDQPTKKDNTIWSDNIESRTQWISSIEGPGNEQSTPNTGNDRLQRSKVIRGIGNIREKQYKQFTRLFQPNFDKFPTQPPVCGRNDGVSYGLDGITFPKWRNESIKAYGNAIVPQVAHQIFKAIKQFENLTA